MFKYIKKKIKKQNQMSPSHFRIVLIEVPVI